MIKQMEAELKRNGKPTQIWLFWDGKASIISEKAIQRFKRK